MRPWSPGPRCWGLAVVMVVVVSSCSVHCAEEGKGVSAAKVVDLGDAFDKATSDLMNSMDDTSGKEKTDEQIDDSDAYDKVDVDHIIDQVGSDLTESSSDVEKETAILHGDQQAGDDGTGHGDGIEDADIFADADSLKDFNPSDSQIRMVEPSEADSDDDNDDGMTGGGDDGNDEKQWEMYEHAVEMRKGDKKEAQVKAATEKAKALKAAKLRESAERSAAGGDHLAASTPKGKWFGVSKSDNDLLYNAITPGAQTATNQQEATLPAGEDGGDGDDEASLEEELGGNEDAKWDDPNYRPFAQVDKEYGEDKVRAKSERPKPLQKSPPSPTNGGASSTDVKVAASDDDGGDFYSSVSGVTVPEMERNEDDDTRPSYPVSEADDDDGSTNGSDGENVLPDLNMPHMNLKTVSGSPDYLRGARVQAAAPTPINGDRDEEWYHPPGDEAWNNAVKPKLTQEEAHSRPHFVKAASTAHLLHADGMSEEAREVPDLMGLLSEKEEEFVLPPESMYGHLPQHDTAMSSFLELEESEDGDDDSEAGSDDDSSMPEDGDENSADDHGDSSDDSDDAPWMTDADVNNLDDSDENEPLNAMATILQTDSDGTVVNQKVKVPRAPEMLESTSPAVEATEKALKAKLGAKAKAAKQRERKHQEFKVMRATTWEVKKNGDGSEKLVTEHLSQHPKVIRDADFAAELDERATSAKEKSHIRRSSSNKGEKGDSSDSDVEVTVLGAKMPKKKLMELEEHINKKLKHKHGHKSRHGHHRNHKVRKSHKSGNDDKNANHHSMSIADMNNVEKIMGDMGPSDSTDVIHKYFSEKTEQEKEAKEKFKHDHGSEVFVVNHSKAQARQQMRHAGLVIAHGASSFRAKPGFQGNGLIPTASATGALTEEDAVYNSQPLTDNSQPGFEDAGSSPFPTLHVALKPNFYHEE